MAEGKETPQTNVGFMTAALEEDRRRQKKADEIVTRILTQQGNWKAELVELNQKAGKVLVEMFHEEMKNGTFIPVEPWEGFVYQRFRSEMKRQKLRTQGIRCPNCDNPTVA